MNLKNQSNVWSIVKVKQSKLKNISRLNEPNRQKNSIILSNHNLRVRLETLHVVAKGFRKILTKGFRKILEFRKILKIYVEIRSRRFNRELSMPMMLEVCKMNKYLSQTVNLTCIKRLVKL